MDGAIVLDDAGERILRANAHLVPDSSIHTDETGTRHRTAERVAKQIGRPVITVSESRAQVTLYLRDGKRALEDVQKQLFRANQGLATLERYRARLIEVSAVLTYREVEDSVTWRDVVLLLQRSEMVRRIAAEVSGLVEELGTEGRLVQLQLDELATSSVDERTLVIRDYLSDRRRKAATIVDSLEELSTDELLASERVVSLLTKDDHELDDEVTPRGYRLLSRIPRLPEAVVDRVVNHFGTLTRIQLADLQELNEVEGVGEARARTIRDGIRRLTDPSNLDRGLPL